jgi:hypothetical protein
MTEETIILPDSPDAAQHLPDLNGWLSRNGRFFKNEHYARYDGSTHKKCPKCATIIVRGRTVCDACWKKSRIDRYSKFPTKKWNGEDPIYSNVYDKFFVSCGQVMVFCETYHCSIEDLLLQICKPVYAREIDPYELYADDLPDESTLPCDILNLFNELNEGIRQSKAILSWMPINIAVDVSEWRGAI